MKGQVQPGLKPDPYRALLTTGLSPWLTDYVVIWTLVHNVLKLSMIEKAIK
jgi:hypothetical protein